MTDTPDFIAQKQVEIILKQPISQRLQLLDDMIEYSRRLARQRLLTQRPSLSETAIRFALIEEYYGDQFSDEQLADIRQQLTAYTSSSNVSNDT